eukprot:gene31463-38859_t
MSSISGMVRYGGTNVAAVDAIVSAKAVQSATGAAAPRWTFAGVAVHQVGAGNADVARA